MTLLLSIVWACSPEHGIQRQKEDVIPPAEPPGDLENVFGNPPDWNDCYEGFRGMYFNLENGHPDMEPTITDPPLDCCSSLDWWEPNRLAVDQFDASIDFGTNWWPVDDGLEDDPSYFATRWVAWIRVWSDGPVTFSLGANTDAWVLYDDDNMLAQMSSQEVYDPREFTADLEATQAHLDIRYGHRLGVENGFRFRVLQGDVTICYPDYTEEEAE